MISKLSQISRAKLSHQKNLGDTEQAMFPLRFNLLANSFVNNNGPLRSIL